MRKVLFFPVILALCVVDSVAFGAASRSSRGSTVAPATQSQNKAPTTAAVTQPTTSARAATRTNVAKPAATAARAATTTAKKPVASTGQKTNAARAAKTTSTVARAGTTQKAISLGTKVESAKENTIISQECQDAYYGCMDMFCMLDNASGGRCQCSDRNVELDNVLEEILKLDEQINLLGTEGLERIQMGDNADVIMARVKSATDKVSTESSTAKGQEKPKKKRTLDLPVWNNDLFSEDDAELQSDDGSATIVADFADKNGDELHNAAAKLCTNQLPDQCRTSSSVLQLAYAQKIKSDCSAYENNLKQQRNTSQQKLQNVQKTLRDAALEMYENENKYDLGQCVIQFEQCLQTTAGCNSDYSGCIADVAILQGLYGGGNAHNSVVPTFDVKTGETKITISKATYDILNGTKQEMCQSVTKQCVNANAGGAVWNAVLRDIAPQVYTAEYSAASNSRMNCISTVVSCVQKTCGSMWDENDNNYDSCLSNPKSIDNYCKLEYERCGDAKSQNNVRSYVMAKLAALRVDKCTKEVKDCLLSENNCGENYEGCIGLDTNTIVDFCVDEKLIACQDKFGKGQEATRDYIARVAQGLALNIDNSFAKACQTAVDAAMGRICSDVDTDDTETCSGLSVSDVEIANTFKWQFCRKGTAECYDSLYDSKITDDRIKANKFEPRLNGLLNVSKIRFSKSNDKFVIDNSTGGKPEQGYTSDGDVVLDAIVGDMNKNYALIMSEVTTDTTIKRCTEGRTFQGIGGLDKDIEGNVTGTKDNEIGDKEKGRFPELLTTLKSKVSNQMLDTVLGKYNSALLSEIKSGTREEMQDEIKERYRALTTDTAGRGTESGGEENEETEEDIATETALEDKYVIFQCRTTKRHMTQDRITDYISTERTLKTLLVDNDDYIECEETFHGKISKCFTSCNDRNSFGTGKVNTVLYGVIPPFCAGVKYGKNEDTGDAVLPFTSIDDYSTVLTYTKEQVDAVFNKIGDKPNYSSDCHTNGANWRWFLLAFKLADEVQELYKDWSNKVTLYDYEEISTSKSDE